MLEYLAPAQKTGVRFPPRPFRKFNIIISIFLGMEVLLDTNFVISCILKKIDFIKQLEERGFKIAVPKEVMEELKDLKFGRKTSHQERAAIKIALEMFKEKKIKKVKLGEKTVDVGLIKKGGEGVYIATLDADIKRNVKNKIVIHSSRKRIGVER